MKLLKWNLFKSKKNQDDEIREFIINLDLKQIGRLDTKDIFSEHRIEWNNELFGYPEYESRSKHKDDLFYDLKEESEFNLPITSITQIRSSRDCSRDYIEEFTSIYGFGKSVYERSDFFRGINDMQILLKHVVERNRDLKIIHYDWTNEYIMYNVDGSHHFSVLYYHSVNRNEDYFLPAKLITYSLNRDNLYNKENINTKFWITNKENIKIICKFFRNFGSIACKPIGSPMVKGVHENRVFEILDDKCGIAKIFSEFPDLFQPIDILFSKEKLDSFA